MSILNFNRHYPIACFPGGAVVKNLPANTADTKDAGSIPGYWRCPGAGNGNSLQYSCLENSMDRGAWWATVHGVAESRTWLSTLTRKHIWLLSPKAGTLNSFTNSVQDDSALYEIKRTFKGPVNLKCCHAGFCFHFSWKMWLWMVHPTFADI